MRQALTFSATIRDDPCCHEDHNGHNDPGTADNIRRRDFGPDSDQPGACGGCDQLGRIRVRHTINRLGGRNMLSVDQFLRFITVPAVFAAFLIASQVSGSGIF